MNYHFELLKRLPITSEMREKLMDNIMLHAPKAVVDAFDRINGDPADDNSVVRLLAGNLRYLVNCENGQVIPSTAAIRILNLVDEGRRINAMKELRTVSGLDLKSAKHIIDQF